MLPFDALTVAEALFEGDFVDDDLVLVDVLDEELVINVLLELLHDAGKASAASEPTEANEKRAVPRMNWSRAIVPSVPCRAPAA